MRSSSYSMTDSGMGGFGITNPSGTLTLQLPPPATGLVGMSGRWDLVVNTKTRQIMVTDGTSHHVCDELFQAFYQAEYTSQNIDVLHCGAQCNSHFARVVPRLCDFAKGAGSSAATWVDATSIAPWAATIAVYNAEGKPNARCSTDFDGTHGAERWVTCFSSSNGKCSASHLFCIECSTGRKRPNASSSSVHVQYRASNRPNARTESSHRTACCSHSSRNSPNARSSNCCDSTTHSSSSRGKSLR